MAVLTGATEKYLFALNIEAHEKDFGTPEGIRSSIPPGDTTKVVIDPKQGRQMVDKLLEERRNFLTEHLALTGKAALAGESGDSVNAGFNTRLLADAHRELQRALNAYWSLEEKGL